MNNSLPPEETTAHVCRVCDRVILGDAIRIEQASASAARPDSHEHPAGDPDCRPVRVPPSTLRRRLRRT